MRRWWRTAVEQPLRLGAELELERRAGPRARPRRRPEVLLPVRLVARHRLPVGELVVRGEDRLEGDAQAGRRCGAGRRTRRRGRPWPSCVSPGGTSAAAIVVGEGEQRGRCRARAGRDRRARHGRRRGPSWPGSPGRSGARRCARRTGRTRTARRTPGRRRSSPPGGLRIVEQTVEQVVPLLLEREAALEFVEHREARAAGRPRWGSRTATGGRTRAACRSVRGRGVRARRPPARSTCAVSSARTRVRSSAAAFSVNVIAAMPVMSTPASTRLTMRSTSELVLPAPAPASTNSVASRSCRMRSRAGLVGRRAA